MSINFWPPLESKGRAGRQAWGLKPSQKVIKNKVMKSPVESGGELGGNQGIRIRGRTFLGRKLARWWKTGESKKISQECGLILKPCLEKHIEKLFLGALGNEWGDIVMLSIKLIGS